MRSGSVLIDHQIFQTQKYGGISRYFAEILPRLAENSKLSMSLFLGNSINEYGLEKHRFKFQYLWGKKASQLLLKTKVANKLNRLFFPVMCLKVQPDILHFTYYRDTNPFYRGKRIITVYDMIHEVFPAQFSTGDATAKWKKEGIAKADMIIAISESTKRDLIKYFNYPPDRIQVVYLANSLKISPSNQSPVPKPYILFVGLRGGYKNFESLLRAFARCEAASDCGVLAFGGPKFSSEEQKLIHDLGLRERVQHRIGGDEELATAYKHARAFVFPSTYEGFGIPPLEAMFYGCPVICSNQSSVPEVVGTAALSVDTTSVEELRMAIAQILQDEPLRKNLIEQGHLQEKKFSWDRCAQEHEQIYLQLLKESKRDSATSAQKV